MPRPAESGRPYVAGLDGIRAIAVLAVIAYHLNFSWAQGGKLGVGVFFTLSGYLITDLLLSHFERTGNLGLKIFWIRRARRLLPALFLMLLVVTVFVALFDSEQLADYRRQVFASVFYVSNWQTIIDSGSYFARFEPPLPLDHLWSLAIEEQYYLVWPWLVLAGLKFMPSRGRLAIGTLALGIASAVTMAVLYSPGTDPTRVYEGTDTRAFELLFGAALAFVWPSSRLQFTITPRARNVLDGAGALGLAVILILIASTGSYASFLYQGGFVLLTIATAVLVAVVVHPASRVGKLLGWEPLRWVGVRSYGIYLWQWPVIVFTSPAGTDVNLLRGAGQVALTLLLASLSWRWVEEPIRRVGFRRWLGRIRERLAVFEPRRALAAAGAAAMLLVLPLLGLAGALPSITTELASADTESALPDDLSAGAAAQPAADATRTSCKRVVYVGDSTSEGSISPNYIPNESKRLEAQLQSVGVKTVDPYIGGARAIYESFQGEPSGADVARAVVAEGINACWILALGTNDAATVAIGSSIDEEDRIEMMMDVIGDHPVMWVGAVSTVPAGEYSSEVMQDWNQELVEECPNYPNMRVFDWAGLAKRDWFIEDGTHYTSPGYVAKTRSIAQALVHAFPQGLPPASGCVVQ
jgi:peptidoglycan/LPS O-acetylase OafA/YrhL